MKKWIILTLLLCLTGCKDSSHLTNTCVKQENVGSFQIETKYTIGFKNDIIDQIDITYDYKDSVKATIDAIRLSWETNNYLDTPYEVVIDEANHYQLVYHLTSESNDLAKNFFHYQEKRSKLVNTLKEEGYTCK